MPSGVIDFPVTGVTDGSTPEPLLFALALVNAFETASVVLFFDSATPPTGVTAPPGSKRLASSFLLTLKAAFVFFIFSSLQPLTFSGFTFAIPLRIDPAAAA